ncbi:hypothetical protein [Guptibacillus spartinae]|nr:hypothetical protein [Pseudalkalibacillus spartinae]
MHYFTIRWIPEAFRVGEKADLEYVQYSRLQLKNEQYGMFLIRMTEM